MPRRLLGRRAKRASWPTRPAASPCCGPPARQVRRRRRLLRRPPLSRRSRCLRRRRCQSARRERRASLHNLQPASRCCALLAPRSTLMSRYTLRHSHRHQHRLPLSLRVLLQLHVLHPSLRPPLLLHRHQHQQRRLGRRPWHHKLLRQPARRCGQLPHLHRQHHRLPHLHRQHHRPPHLHRLR